MSKYGLQITIIVRVCDGTYSDYLYAKVSMILTSISLGLVGLIFLFFLWEIYMACKEND